MDKNRQYNIDMLRIFACIMVLFLHVAGHNWSSVPVADSRWMALNVYDCLVRAAVPVFLMISGSLFLQKEEISVKKLFTKNVLRLVLLYIFWSLLYALDTIGMKGLFTDGTLKRLLTLTVTSKYHLWYLPALVGVYLLVPIFIAMKEYRGGAFLDYTAALFFIFAILRYSILLLPLSTPIKDLLQKFNFTLDSFCGYFLMGHVLKRHEKKLSRIPLAILLAAFFGAVLLTASASYLLSVKRGEAVSDLYNSFFITTFIEAVAIFLIFAKIPSQKLSKRGVTIIGKLSKYTLFTYLFHPFVIEHLDLWLGFDSLSFSPWLSVPVLCIILYLICTAVAFLIDLIPFVKKILV